jgi:hypothetical protein
VERAAKSLVVAAAFAGALALVALAAAGTAANRERVELTPAGQADARAAVLRRADLSTTLSWSGGETKPDIASDFPFSSCSYHPKQSDLVLNGAAEADWKATGIEFSSEANVLETPAMVTLDWQRSIAAPEVLPCLRDGFAKQLERGERLASFTRLALPGLAEYAREYRAIIDVSAASGTGQVLIDVIVLGRGRTEITLTATAAYAIRSAVDQAELALAEVLVSRVRA